MRASLFVHWPERAPSLAFSLHESRRQSFNGFHFSKLFFCYQVILYLTL